MRENLRLTFRVLVYQEGPIWLAHCLELDIVAEGDGPQDALSAVKRLCELQVCAAYDEGDLDSIFRAAPPEFWRMYSLAADLDVSAGPDSTRFEVRELAFA